MTLDKLRQLLTDEGYGSSSKRQRSQTTADLYECPACGTVYIADDMETCSSCESEVTQVPDERQLGIQPK